MKNKIFITIIVLLVAGLIVFAISKNENPEIIPAKTDSTIQTVQEKVATTTTSSEKKSSITTPQKSTSVTAPIITPKPETTVEVKVQEEVPTENTFTIQEVSQHSTEADCYSAIDGVVYDLTAWINKHPGGDRNILRICGIDGSKAYNSEHSGEKKADNSLAGFEVGILKN